MRYGTFRARTSGSRGAEAADALAPVDVRRTGMWLGGDGATPVPKLRPPYSSLAVSSRDEPWEEEGTMSATGYERGEVPYERGEG